MMKMNRAPETNGVPSSLLIYIIRVPEGKKREIRRQKKCLKKQGWAYVYNPSYSGGGDWKNSSLR
jgi:hypothetical protein